MAPTTVTLTHDSRRFPSAFLPDSAVTLVPDNKRYVALSHKVKDVVVSHSEKKSPDSFHPIMLNVSYTSEKAFVYNECVHQPALEVPNYDGHPNENSIHDTDMRPRSFRSNAPILDRYDMSPICVAEFALFKGESDLAQCFVFLDNPAIIVIKLFSGETHEVSLPRLDFNKLYADITQNDSDPEDRLSSSAKLMTNAINDDIIYNHHPLDYHDSQEPEQVNHENHQHGSQPVLRHLDVQHGIIINQLWPLKHGIIIGVTKEKKESLHFLMEHPLTPIKILSNSFRGENIFFTDRSSSLVLSYSRSLAKSKMASSSLDDASAAALIDDVTDPPQDTLLKWLYHIKFWHFDEIESSDIHNARLKVDAERHHRYRDQESRWRPMYTESIDVESHSSRFINDPSAFFSHNFYGDLILSIFIRPKLLGFSVALDLSVVDGPKYIFRHVFTYLNVIAATAVISTREDTKDILLVPHYHAEYQEHEDQNVVNISSNFKRAILAVGDTPILALNIPLPDSLSSQKTPICTFRDSIASCVSIQTSDRIFIRADVDLINRTRQEPSSEFKTASLNSICLATLDRVLPQSYALKIRAQVIALQYSKDRLVCRSSKNLDDEALLFFLNTQIDFLDQKNSPVEQDSSLRSDANDEWFKFLACQEEVPVYCPKVNFPSPNHSLTSHVNNSMAGLEMCTPLKIILSATKSLHLVHEEFKLIKKRRTDRMFLAAMLTKLIRRLGLRSYLMYYIQTYGQKLIESWTWNVSEAQLAYNDQKEKLTHDDCITSSVPNIYSYLRSLFKPFKHSPYVLIEPLSLRVTVPEYCALDPLNSSLTFSKKIIEIYSKLSDEKSLLEDIVADFSNWTQEDIEGLEFGVAIPLLEFLWNCRKKPNAEWPVAFLKLIDRDDLVALREAKRIETYDLSFLQKSFIACEKAAHHWEKPAEHLTQKYDQDIDKEKSIDGCEYKHDSVFHLRFGSDQRLDEVCRLLRSTQPVTLNFSRAAESTDVEYAHHQQQKLLASLNKILAAPFGRGALALKCDTLNDPTEPFRVPPIALAGIITEKKGVLLNVNKNDLKDDYLIWSEFHNGVAAALRYNTSTAMKRTWILNQKSDDPAKVNSHAGFLLGLGLNGHLSVLNATDWYFYLLSRHALTSVGLMLGIAASRRKSMDSVATRMLCMHIRHFNCGGFAQPDWKVEPIVQAGAIYGLGLLYQGRCTRLIVEGLLMELSAKIQPGDSYTQLDAISLSAGLALGMVCLGQGNDIPGLADLKLADRLIAYCIGGMEKDLKNEKISDTDFELEPVLLREPNYTDVSSTAPGAILALGLIYLRTNDNSVLSRLKVPDSIYDLDRTFPEHLMLRVLASSLIAWSDISPTTQWVASWFSPMFQEPVELDLSASSIYSMSDEDQHQLEESRIFIYTGACLSLGIRFAGTMDFNAYQLIFDIFSKFEKTGKWGSSKLHMICLQLMTLSLCLTMAGSGNLKLMKVVRKLRKRASARYDYKALVASQLGLGILFLGFGCQTLNTSNESIAAIVTAIYPYFPDNVQDNDYHLQALRHMYVLASEPRCIELKDIDTGLSCYVPIRITAQSDSNDIFSINAVTPFLSPSNIRIVSLSVESPRYWSLSLEKKDMKDVISSLILQNDRRVILVKRKPGHLTYSQDFFGSKSILSRPFRSNTNELLQIASSLSSNPHILAFVFSFCGSFQNEELEFYRAIVHECIVNGKPEALFPYIGIFSTFRKISRALSKGIDSSKEECEDFGPFSNLCLVMDYYRSDMYESLCFKQGSDLKFERFIQRKFVDELYYKLENAINMDRAYVFFNRAIQSKSWPVSEDLFAHTETDIRLFLELFQIDMAKLVQLLGNLKSFDGLSGPDCFFQLSSLDVQIPKASLLHLAQALTNKKIG